MSFSFWVFLSPEGFLPFILGLTFPSPLGVQTPQGKRYTLEHPPLLFLASTLDLPILALYWWHLNTQSGDQCRLPFWTLPCHLPVANPQHPDTPSTKAGHSKTQDCPHIFSVALIYCPYQTELTKEAYMPKTSPQK